MKRKRKDSFRPQKRMRHICGIVVGLIVSIWTQVYGQQYHGFNCYSIIVGKNASADGSVMLAHNEDDQSPQLVNFYRCLPERHEAAEQVVFRRGASIAQISYTHGFYWIELPGMEVSDAFMNDQGVVIASDGCPSREDKPDLTDGGLVWWLRRLVAERAHSARQGVKLAGALIEQFGYASSGRTYVIADRNEGWMLAVVHGKHWVAQRVPDDHVAVIPNFYTIGEIDLSDTLNFYGSADIIDYAIERGWYHPETDGPFHFARAYSARFSLNHPGNTHRMWRGVNLLARESYPLDGPFPFSFAPKRKVSVADVMAVLRDHYEGCELDRSQSGEGGDPHQLNSATICAGSTQYSFVAQLRGNMPLSVGAVLWLAYYRPGLQLYTPWYAGMTSIPDGYALLGATAALRVHFEPPPSTFQAVDSHPYWDYYAAVTRVIADYPRFSPAVLRRRNAIQQALFREVQAVEARAVIMNETVPAAVRELLTEFSHRWARHAREYARQIAR